MTDPAPRRGEVWLARLDKVRPVVVLTRDPLGAYLHSVIVGPVTTRVRGHAAEVGIGPADGIRVPSVVNLDNLQMLHRSHLVRRVGRATASTMTSICGGVAIAIGCDR